MSVSYTPAPKQSNWGEEAPTLSPKLLLERYLELDEVVAAEELDGGGHLPLRHFQLTQDGRCQLHHTNTHPARQSKTTSIKMDVASWKSAL